ncbi:type II toxin-antitoxin system VapC family toxin [Pseudolysinimonas sp.]|uniref:type II toxin-antitoxin system VapC family toxin n=1 Tax=Pseudolysinimonas sp. TaxID=2680009 RepID=UPI00286BA12E|nr:type II toxin-antitoxin system VapC family toxin [Pseudolysinimonas sp.]
MRVVDANVLLYAVNEDALHHTSSRTWLDRALGGADTVGLSWLVLLAFVRLSTKPGLFERPLGIDEALEQVQAWIGAPGAVVVSPGSAHADLLRRTLADLGVGGNLVNDAHLVALALEHHADVVSYDNDFSRFAGVRWRTPDGLL